MRVKEGEEGKRRKERGRRERATFRAVGTGYEVDPFTILKSPYPTGQPALSGKSSHIP